MTDRPGARSPSSRVLTREAIRDGVVRRMITAGGVYLKLLTEEELDASRHALLAEVAPATDVWVFGYGSLMWNPAFHFIERRPGTVYGYHRRFCLWTHLGRGSPENPGLTLGLRAGGSCAGVAFRVAASEAESELTIVWRREMVTGAYRPRWVRVHTPDGPVTAAAFVINHDHVRYAGELPDATMAQAIARAAGDLGPCAEYLFNTVAHLDQLGIRDGPMHRLRDQVDEYCAREGIPVHRGEG